MIKTFVLIMVIKYTGVGFTSTTAEFNNELACLNAAKAIAADLKEDNRTIVVSYNCYPKE